MLKDFHTRYFWKNAQNFSRCGKRGRELLGVSIILSIREEITDTQIRCGDSGDAGSRAFSRLPLTLRVEAAFHALQLSRWSRRAGGKRAQRKENETSAKGDILHFCNVDEPATAAEERTQSISPRLQAARQFFFGFVFAFFPILS